PSAAEVAVHDDASGAALAGAPEPAALLAGSAGGTCGCTVVRVAGRGTGVRDAVVCQGASERVEASRASRAARPAARDGAEVPRAGDAVGRGANEDESGLAAVRTLVAECADPPDMAECRPRDDLLRPNGSVSMLSASWSRT